MAGGQFSTYAYVGGRPLSYVDTEGLADEGPWHPPTGEAPGCKGNDDCPVLKQKMAVLNMMLSSHVAWDAIHGPRHTKEIQDLANGVKKCMKFLRRKKCDDCESGKTVPEKIKDFLTSPSSTEDDPLGVEGKDSKNRSSGGNAQPLFNPASRFFFVP